MDMQREGSYPLSFVTVINKIAVTSLGRIYGSGITGESTCLLLRFLFRIFRKFLPVMGLSSISTPQLTCPSFLV